MTPRRGWGQLAFRLYAAVYVALLALGALSDIGESGLHAIPLTPTQVSLGGVAVLAVVVTAGLAGRRAVFLRPSAAEVQHSLLSSTPRPRSLRRSLVASLGSAVGVTAIAGFVVMAAFPNTFGGLDLRGRLAFVAFASALGALALAVHLLVAERRGRPLTIVGVAVGLTVVIDAARGSVSLPLSALTRGLFTRSPLPAVLWTISAACAGGWVAWRQSERVPLERITGGSAAVDGASLALAGNDVRSLMLASRAFGGRRWRSTPLFRVPTSVAVRWPATSRSLRSIARWRIGTWFAVVSLTSAVAAILTSRGASPLRAGLAAMLLWALGLTVNEPLAQEHDRKDRLDLLADATSVELRLAAVAWSFAFAFLSIALLPRLPAVPALCLAAAAASAATSSSTMSVRAKWKLLLDPNRAGVPPEALASEMLFKLLRPGLVGMACLLAWESGAHGLAAIAPAAAIVTLLAVAIRTDDFRVARGLILRKLVR